MLLCLSYLRVPDCGQRFAQTSRKRGFRPIIFLGFYGCDLSYLIQICGAVLDFDGGLDFGDRHL